MKLAFQGISSSEDLPSPTDFDCRAVLMISFQRSGQLARGGNWAWSISCVSAKLGLFWSIFTNKLLERTALCRHQSGGRPENSILNCWAVTESVNPIEPPHTISNIKIFKGNPTDIRIWPDYKETERSPKYTRPFFPFEAKHPSSDCGTFMEAGRVRTGLRAWISISPFVNNSVFKYSSMTERDRRQIPNLIESHAHFPNSTVFLFLHGYSSV